ncbi:protein of unknown function [Burkholderia multivorans]
MNLQCRTDIWVSNWVDSQMA